MSKRKESYTPAPRLEPAIAERLALILEVVSGNTTVSDAARTLGLSRNQFQALMHRALEGLAQSLAPKPAGRPAKSSEEAALLEEIERLRQENARLQDRAGTTERLLQAASGILQGRIRPIRQSRTRKPAGSQDDKGEH